MRCAPAAGLALLVTLLWLWLSGGAHAQEAAASLYVRSDSDQTTVITPRLRVGADLAPGTSAELVYMVDVWTSASVDIRTSASRTITQDGIDTGKVVPVTEQRDEIDVGLTQELSPVTLTGGYRYSTEPDYESHTVSLNVGLGLFQKNTELGLGGSAGFDDVGRAGDPGFSRSLRTLGAAFSVTQLIDDSTWLSFDYELGHARGYMASPYRQVGVGTDDGTCRGSPVFCLPETVPELRVRHALSLRGRRALGDHFSLGAGYRYYFDDWELSSHTISADAAFLPDRPSVIGLRYRYYTQSATGFYQPQYAEETADGLYTRDKELSPLDSHRLTLHLERAFELSDDGHVLRVVVEAGPVFYAYRDYVPLDEITALDATIAMVIER